METYNQKTKQWVTPAVYPTTEEIKAVMDGVFGKPVPFKIAERCIIINKSMTTAQKAAFKAAIDTKITVEVVK